MVEFKKNCIRNGSFYTTKKLLDKKSKDQKYNFFYYWEKIYNCKNKIHNYKKNVLIFFYIISI